LAKQATPFGVIGGKLNTFDQFRDISGTAEDREETFISIRLVCRQ